MPVPSPSPTVTPSPSPTPVSYDLTAIRCIILKQQISAMGADRNGDGLIDAADMIRTYHN